MSLMARSRAKLEDVSISSLRPSRSAFMRLSASSTRSMSSRRLLAALVARDGAPEVVAAVANAFEFADFAQHSTYLPLGVVAEVGVADESEVFTNFVLHVVAYLLVLLETLENLRRLVAVGLVEEVAHDAVHT